MTRAILFMTVLGLAIGLAIGPVAAQELKSLRAAPIDENSEAPDVFQVEQDNRFLRSFRLQPPMVPHKIDKYEIDLKVNQCLRCHDWRRAAAERAPEISKTHYQDPRSGEELDQVSGSRWFCTQCHSPQLDARPLVENEFTDQPAANQ